MTRLIMPEGLPGTGKTTNSYRLYDQLVRNERDVCWLHEVSQPHGISNCLLNCVVDGVIPEVLRGQFIINGTLPFAQLIPPGIVIYPHLLKAQ